MPYSQMAKHVQSRGRGEDTMLVHMTPGEVGGLQSLARAAGGSLTINPETGLPEASFLSGLLPMLGGALLSMIPGVGTLAAAGLVGAADTAATGSLTKGLMAGLGAFGGASLATGLASGAASGASAATGATTGAASGAGAGAAGAAGALGGLSAEEASALYGSDVASALGGTATATGAAGATNLANSGNLLQRTIAASRAPFEPGSSLASATAAKYAPYAAGLGLLGGVSDMMSHSPGSGPQQQVPIYNGPYHYAPRTVNPQASQLVMGPNGVYQAPTQEAQFFNTYNMQLLDKNNNPYVYETAPANKINQFGGVGNMPTGYASGGPINQPSPPNQTVPQPAAETMASTGNNPEFMAPQDPIAAMRANMNAPQFQAPQIPPPAPAQQVGNNPNGTSQIKGLPAISNYARGGAMPIKDGSFIVDARTVSELGNGSSSAGQDLLARWGGHPLHGPGDGVSDSIPASIGGTQKARVARDEVKFDPEAVARLGSGSHSKGTQKLYALMKKAENARKKAKRGQDTGLRKGLA